MQQVITIEQARHITGGRTPLVPVEYERALVALRQCQSIDDSKYWADKADALAAWAKIYQSDETERQAKALKLHAYRRMGILAAEIRPRSGSGHKSGIGAAPGPLSLLIEKGMKPHGAMAARRLALISEEQFQALVDRPIPPSPSSASRCIEGSWTTAMSCSGLNQMMNFCPKNNAAEMAKLLEPKSRAQIAGRVRIVIEWLDELEANLK